MRNHAATSGVIRYGEQTLPTATPQAIASGHRIPRVTV